VQKTEKDMDEHTLNLTSRWVSVVVLPLAIRLKELSEKIGIALPKILMECIKNGLQVNLNSVIEYDIAAVIAESLWVATERESAESIGQNILDETITDILKREDPSKQTIRPPIISVLGHVDHGKTSLLDAIRSSNVAAGEAGGITQKIGAYQVIKNDRKITCIDTPGHEAFGFMRARGAKLTDIAILVIAGDEWMKPQTIESIGHIKQAGVPMIIAITKIDRGNVNMDRIRTQLSEQEIITEEWGGSTIMVPVSAHTGEGIDTLLDMILLVADMQPAKATNARLAVATVIESNMDVDAWVLTTILINTGTLTKGQVIVAGVAHGRVRSMKDASGKIIEKAEPGMPVVITGLSQLTQGGDLVRGVEDIATARAIASEVASNKPSDGFAFEKASLEAIVSKIQAGKLRTLKVVIKADSFGSVQALNEALEKIGSGSVRLQVIHKWVGDINQSDVLMAGTSEGLIVGLNVGIAPQAREILQQSKIECVIKDVIYHILERVEMIATGMIETETMEEILGHGRVEAIFYSSKEKIITGIEIKDGRIVSKCHVRISRGETLLGHGEITNIKSGPSNVHEMLAGNFCGSNLITSVKVEVNDLVEIYRTVAKK
jgi:translation initiation factor IF-2